MTKREELLAHEPILPLFFRFSIPAIIGMLVQALYNIVDRFYIANIPEIGSTAIGGIGITMPVTFILMGFSMLFGFGGGANISISLGEQDTQKASHVLGNVFTMLGLSALVLLILIGGNLYGVLNLFGATDANINYAAGYLRIIVWGNLINTFAFAMNALVRAEGAPRWSMISMIVGALVNIILDPIFIYETVPIINLPGLGLGVEGAALATVIAQLASFIVGISFYLWKRSILRPKAADFIPNLKIIQTIVAIGFSSFFIQVAGSAVGAIFNNNLAFYGGELAQSAYALANSLAVLFYMPVFGMNQGLQPIIGYNYGAKNYDRVVKATKVGLLAATLVTGAGWILILLAPEVLVTPMAREDLALRALSIDGLRKLEAAMVIVAVQIITTNYFTSIGKAKISFFLSLSRQVIFLIPLILILPKFMGLDGIWWSLPASDVLATIMSLFFLYREFKNMDKLRRAT